MTSCIQPGALYFHSNRRDVTYRIWQLLDTQKKALVDFLLSDGQGAPNPLPTLPDTKNLVRVDPEDPIEETGIYRDAWERKPLAEDDIVSDPRTHCCMGDTVEYPNREDERRSKNKAWIRQALIRERLIEEILQG